MIKNLFLLAILTWVTTSYGKGPIAKETVDEAQGFKVEAPVMEQDAQRAVAGDPIKKKVKKQRHQRANQYQNFSEEFDSEVRYWEYSE
jgi:hypothetical protein